MTYGCGTKGKTVLGQEVKGTRKIVKNGNVPIARRSVSSASTTFRGMRTKGATTGKDKKRLTKKQNTVGFKRRN